VPGYGAAGYVWIAGVRACQAVGRFALAQAARYRGVYVDA
jgi:hypothetical protein